MITQTPLPYDADALPVGVGLVRAGRRPARPDERVDRHRHPRAEVAPAP